MNPYPFANSVPPPIVARARARSAEVEMVMIFFMAGLLKWGLNAMSKPR